MYQLLRDDCKTTQIMTLWFHFTITRHKVSMGYNTILQYCSQIYGHPRILPTSATGSHNITHSTQDKRLERFYEPNVHKRLSLPHWPFWVQKTTSSKLKLPFAAKTRCVSEMSIAWNFAHDFRYQLHQNIRLVDWFVCTPSTLTPASVLFELFKELFVSTGFTPKVLKIENIYN